MQKSITMNLQTYKKLKKEHNKAVLNQKPTFMFEGSELVTDYAKYLLEHMKNVLRI